MDIGTAYVQIVPSAQGISENIRKALGDDDAGGESKGKKIASGIAKGIGAAAGAVGGAIAVIGKEAIESYADYEQLVGGVETLFGDAANTIMDNASEAFKTAGMSANEYMETATASAAAMVNSLGGDTAKAAELTDVAIRDMSDNANKMGTSMESISTAYAGFAKQNYTMLDNLKLGYGGTKTEMERLLADAEKFSGIQYDISSYSDIVSAIHVIQDEMGITGTTAAEAEKTISGSFASMKSSIDNLLTGLGGADADIGALVTNVATSFTNVAQNLTPVIQNVLSALPTVLGAILEQVGALAPQLLTTAGDLISQLVVAVAESAPLLGDAVGDLVIQLSQALIDNAPQILSAGLELLLTLGESILQATPDVAMQIPSLVLGLLDEITTFIPDMISTGVELLTSLIGDLPAIITAIVEAIPEIINNITGSITELVPLLVQAGFDLFVALIQNLPQIIVEIIKAVPDIIASLVEAFFSFTGTIEEVGTDLVTGIFNGISNAVGWLYEKLSGWVSSVLSYIKGLFGIHSPSKETAWMGKMLDQGLANGITKNTSGVLLSARRMGEALTSTLAGYTSTDFTVNGSVNGRGGIAGGAQPTRLSAIMQLDGQTLGNVVYDLNGRATTRYGVDLVGGY